MNGGDSIPVSIEVSISDLFRGVFEINGALRLLPDKLILRYSGERLTGSVKFRHTLELDHDDVRDLVLKERPWGIRIVIYPKRLTAFKQLPGESHDRVVLRAERRYRKQARAAVAGFREELQDRAQYDITGIPFSLPDVGVSEIKGVLFLESDRVILEIVSGLPGVTRSRTMRVEISMDAVEGVDLDAGLRRDTLYLRCGEELLEDIPGRHAGELRLRIRRRHRQDAALLVKVVEERRLLGA